MRRIPSVLLTLLTLSLLIGGCSDPAPPLPSSMNLTTDSSAPLTVVTFLVSPPPETTSATKISLQLLDSVAGLEMQTASSSMSRMSDGRYETKLTVPVGSLLTYRFVRDKPSEAVEVTTNFEPVSNRVTYIPGPSQIEETIAGWSDTPSSSPTGRIIGRIINLETGEGQNELIVSAGGITTFSEANGAFRIDGLTEGIHHLTVLSPDGAFLPNAQAALVAGGATTPAELQVHPAKPVFVTFQLTVPEGLSPDAIVHLAGNISTLGNRFSELDGGMRVSVEHMPTLVRVDEVHFLAVLSLYAGTDLRYKYTLGDGLWNAERDAEGSILNRQVILPEQDIILRDSVTAWGIPEAPPVRFIVQIPENTTGGDQISIQLKPSDWFEPLPMWPLSSDTWYYDLYRPLENNVEIQYRYCRNSQCGAADDAHTAGYDADGRILANRGQAWILDDEVLAWKWLEEIPPVATITSEPTSSRPRVRTGIEIAAHYHPSWRTKLKESFDHIQALGSNSVILPLVWSWQQQNPFPLLSFDPSTSPFRDELQDLVLTSQGTGLVMMLKAHPSSAGQDASTWWETAARDSSWWQLWFDEYRSFALTAAQLAGELGIDVLVLGGEWISPALPEGVLQNDDPSGVPEDAEDYWRSLISDLRGIYSGRIAFELDLRQEVPNMPTFLDSVDAIILHWQIPITPGSEGNVELMAQGFVPFLDLLDSRTERINRPLWISIEYASVQGGATSCPPAPDGSCRPIALFEAGQDIDPDLAVSFQEQTNAINAVFLATHDRSSIQGFFIQGFNPTAILWDKSSSIYGKPAEDVLRYWYPRLTNQ
jgi:hypothetical protein